MPTMTSDTRADRLWAEVLDALRLQMARETFQWLQGSRVVESGPGTLAIGIQAAHGVEWLRHRLHARIEQAVERVAGRPVAVAFVAGCPGQEREERAAGPDSEEEQVGQAASPAQAAQQRSAPEKKLSPAHYYIRIRTAFRQRAVRELAGPPLSVFLILAMHLDGDGVASPGVETIMRETGYSRRAVCSALAKLVNLGLISQRGCRHRAIAYAVNAYAWFGAGEAPALWED
jgi:hypothetical protein